MKTKHILIKSDKSESGLKAAAKELRAGEVVAFPTETVYGLGAAVSSEEGLRKIFEVKGRPADNPLIVHITELAELNDLVREISPEAKKLMQAFWPGPLTLIFKKKETVSPLITAGLDTVAIRMPDNPVARDLIKTLGEPIAAPSANISGKPSITRDSDLIKEFDGKVSALVLSEPSRIGIESTVLDLTTEPTVLRPGYIDRDDLKAVLDQDILKGYGQKIKKPKSPGMKYTHYSPRAKVILVKGDKRQLNEKICEYISQHPHEKFGVIVIGEDIDFAETLKTVVVKDTADYRHRAYTLLRDLDEAGVTTILAQKPKESEANAALIDRLEHASGYAEI